MTLSPQRITVEENRAKTAFQLAGWYVALLVPTLAFKYVYLAALSAGGSAALNRLAATNSHVPLWWVHVHDVAPGDVLDVFCLVAGLWLVGRVLLKIPIAALACASVCAILVVGGAHLIAIREVGALLTLDNVRITRDWITDHPTLVGQFLTPRRLAWLTAGLAWAATPALFAAGWRRLHARQPRTSRALAVVMALVLGASLAFGASAAVRSTRGALRRGFWTSIVLSALSNDATSSRPAAVRSRSDLLAAYDQIVFPHGDGQRSYVVDVPPGRRTPRHLVIFTLETAPLKYYPIADSPDLPVLHAMGSHALVSTEHYASAPITNLVVYSLLTGTYPPPGSPTLQVGFKTDGIADVLAEHGYETSFIESYDLQWNGPNDERVLRDLGFSTIRDAIQLTGRRQADWDSYRIAVETRTFDAALEQVTAAARRGRKAFAFVETNLGHYDWLRPPGQRDVSAADRIAYTAKTLDGLMGRFLNGLAEQGLTDDVLIVVTGDHGLRFKMEFESVSADMAYGDLVFNVPFLAYCPGLFPSQVRLPYPTSHIDVAPTALDLLGIPREERLYLGRNMLDRRLGDRIVFLPSASFTGLYPADSLRWKDNVYSLHRILDRVTVRPAHTSAFVSLADRPDLPFSESDVRRLVSSARTVFEDTSAYFQRRFTQASGVSVSRE
jgi:Sulfatase